MSDDDKKPPAQSVPLPLRQEMLRKDIAVWPVSRFNVGKYGAYGAVRSDKSRGWCPPDKYPCTHYGADLSAPEGTEVVAPHDGWILYDGPANAAPFSGYGPWCVLIAHYDVSDSLWSRTWKFLNKPLWDWDDFPDNGVAARYTLIGHLAHKQQPPAEPTREQLLDIEDPKKLKEAPKDPQAKALVELPSDIWDSTIPKGAKQVDATTGKLKNAKDTAAWRKFGDGTVVMTNEAKGYDPARIVYAGNKIGNVSAANHVHWELRTSPLAGRAGRIDPIAAWIQGYGLKLPEGVTIAEPARGGGGGDAGLLLLLLALGQRKKKRR
ncbi:MAG: M23 family metallopeptidase [Gammaproteobacteria bacterium]